MANLLWTILVVLVVLWLLGFFRPGEVQMLVGMRDQLTSVARRTSPGEETEIAGEIAGVLAAAKAAPLPTAADLMTDVYVSY